MVDTPKKKRGFLSKLGFKSKEDKLAEEAAAKAAQQQLVDEQMAARMAAINAAALKSARKQDSAASGETVDAAEQARIEAEEKRQAEIQAAKDVERAKQLAEERARAEQEATKEKELAAQREREAKARAEEKARLEAEQKAQREAQNKLRAEQEAKRAAEEKAQLERAEKEGAAKAAALKLRQEEDAKLRAEEDTRRAAEEAEKIAADKAQAERIEAERIAAEQAAAEKAKAERIAFEAREAERRAEIAARRAEADAKAKAEEEALAAQRAAERERLGLSAQEQEPDTLAETGFFNRITKGLSKSTSKMSDSMSTLFTKRKLDDDAIEDLEDLLITSDLGIGVANQVTTLLARDKFDKQVTDMEIKIALADVISDILTPLEKPIRLTGAKPEIMLFVGVNGSGKTTTLGKLAKRYGDQGKKVMLAAGDTFRAAAVEQLTVWGERAGAPVVSGKPGADAAGLVYDAIERAKAEDIDILMIDTAGRLQNRTELMDELSKVVRVIKKQDPSAPHHCILVLDATVGQNALMQTEAFKNTAGVTGLIMTKLDGTAKGGVLVALSDKYKLPIHHIGIGERIEDLENFSAPVFAAALSGVADAMLDGKR